MNGKVVHLGPDAHQALQELLPWYVTGRLAPLQRARVETHLAGCPECQAEVEAQRRLRALAAMPGSPAGDVDVALARLRAQIESERAAPRRLLDDEQGERELAANAGGLPRNVSRGWQWVAALQAVLIVGLGAVLAVGPRSDRAAYLGLGAPVGVASAGNAVVKFRPDATDAQIRAALTAAGARIVNGPTATDAYVLALPPAELAGAMARLHREPSVLLAESLEGKAAP